MSLSCLKPSGPLNVFDINSNFIPWHWKTLTIHLPSFILRVSPQPPRSHHSGKLAVPCTHHAVTYLNIPPVWSLYLQHQAQPHLRRPSQADVSSALNAQASLLLQSIFWCSLLRNMPPPAPSPVFLSALHHEACACEGLYFSSVLRSTSCTPSLEHSYAHWHLFFSFLFPHETSLKPGLC